MPAGVQVDGGCNGVHAANGAADGSRNRAINGRDVGAAETAEEKGAVGTPTAAAAAAGAQLGKKALDKLRGSEGQLEGYEPDLVAGQLTHALQVDEGSSLGKQCLAAQVLGRVGLQAAPSSRWHMACLPPNWGGGHTCTASPSPCIPLPQELFPSSFASLVRVHNHEAADCLLVKYDAGAARRDRWAAAAAAARLRLKALGGMADGAEQQEGGAGGKGSAGDKIGGSKAGGRSGWRRRQAAKRLARAEAEEDKWRQRAADLEAMVEAARQEALTQPLGTAFIALFR